MLKLSLKAVFNEYLGIKKQLSLIFDGTNPPAKGYWRCVCTLKKS